MNRGSRGYAILASRLLVTRPFKPAHLMPHPPPPLAVSLFLPFLKRTLHTLDSPAWNTPATYSLFRKPRDSHPSDHGA